MDRFVARGLRFFISLILISFNTQAAWGNHCSEIFIYEIPSQVLTSTRNPYRTIEDPKEFAFDKVLDSFGMPIRIVDRSSGEPQTVGPIIIRRLSEFSKAERDLIMDLFVHSVRPSWLVRAADQRFMEQLETLATRNNLTVPELRAVLEKNPELIEKSISDNVKMIQELGVSVGKLVVEFANGEKIESDIFTSLQTNRLNYEFKDLDVLLHLAEGRVVKNISVFRTHPSRSPGEPFVNVRDIDALKTIRRELAKWTEADAVNYHIFSITRLDRVLTVAHYSGNGKGL